MGGIENLQEARDLQQLANGANNYLQSTYLLNTQPAPRVNHTQHSIARKAKRTHIKAVTSKGDPNSGQNAASRWATSKSNTIQNSPHQHQECCSNQKKRSTKIQHALFVETHHMNGKWSTRSAGRNGCWNRQGTQLQTINMKPET